MYGIRQRKLRPFPSPFQSLLFRDTYRYIGGSPTRLIKLSICRHRLYWADLRARKDWMRGRGFTTSAEPRSSIR